MDRKFKVTTSNHVLNFEIKKFYLEYKMVISSKFSLYTNWLTGKLSAFKITAYSLAANLESSSDLAPVHTIFPELKIRAVVFGFRILIITAGKRLGLYSTLGALRAIFFRSNLNPRFTDDTIFLKIKCLIRKETDIIFCLLLKLRLRNNSWISTSWCGWVKHSRS